MFHYKNILRLELFNTKEMEQHGVALYYHAAVLRVYQQLEIKFGWMWPSLTPLL